MLLRGVGEQERALWMMASGFSEIFLLEGEGLSLNFGVAGFLNSS